MADVQVLEIATDQLFDEERYLAANADVAVATQHRLFASGWDHFDRHGRMEGRKILRAGCLDAIATQRRSKYRRLEPCLEGSFSTSVGADLVVDALSDELRAHVAAHPTTNVSSLSYDEEAWQIIEDARGGLVLDLGAGFRDVYVDNVVHHEVVRYPTTDVMGAGEKLPFKSNAFDAVLCFAVLEHVKYPWLVAQEMCRVLKPGGRLAVNAPFLAPLHGYPGHYYNMSGSGCWRSSRTASQFRSTRASGYGADLGLELDRLFVGDGPHRAGEGRIPQADRRRTDAIAHGVPCPAVRYGAARSKAVRDCVRDLSDRAEEACCCRSPLT